MNIYPIIQFDIYIYIYIYIYINVYINSIKWIRLAHFLTPNFTPKILTHKILTPNTHA